MQTEQGGDYRIDGWTLDKRISFGHLLTTLAIILAFGGWMIKMETQMAEVRQLIIANTKRIDHIESTQDANYREIIRRLERFEDKLTSHMGRVWPKDEQP